MLDTKSFSLRTGERTFDAAAYLRRSGADTTEVKKLFQTDMEDTMARYKVMQRVELYRGVAIAAPEEPQKRVVAAQAADELLNISGVDASIVIAPDGKGKIYASARSIGEMNVQILMEKLGGGGNRSAAAVQFTDTSLEEAVEKGLSRHRRVSGLSARHHSAIERRAEDKERRLFSIPTSEGRARRAR